MQIIDEEAAAKIVSQENNIIKLLSFTDPEESIVSNVLFNIDEK